MKYLEWDKDGNAWVQVHKDDPVCEDCGWVLAALLQVLAEKNEDIN